MRGLSHFLKTHPSDHSSRTKSILACLLILIFILFFASMAIEGFVNGSRNLNDLTHVTGAINNERYIKHWHSATKYRAAYYENVFVFSLQGCEDEFGFTENDKEYTFLTKVRYGKTEAIADIYYNKSGPRIEENVTLLIYDLKINDEQYAKIEDAKKWRFTSSAIFFLPVILLGWLAFAVLKDINKKRKKTQHMRSDH